LHPINDDVEYLEMKLFFVPLHESARKSYENLPHASITTMEQLEETFLKIWVIQLEEIPVLLKKIEHIKQIENEIVRQLLDRFEEILYQIPGSHHPEDRYIINLYTNALLLHLWFLLNKRVPKMLDEAHNMAK